MTADRIRVGIVGASAERGWAKMAHIPALEALPQFELTAVGTSRVQTARQAAAEYGAAHAFANASELAAHPDVDLVVVNVKVPHHAELIRAALTEGKHVHSEWPLARTTAEAETLLASAETAGVHHSVGLQARFSPVLNHARDLIADGYVGKVSSVTVYSSLSHRAGGTVSQATAYTVDRDNGASLVRVAGGHTLDALEHLVGGIAELSATLSVQYKDLTVAETGERIVATSADHLLVDAVLDSGAVAAVHIHKGKVAAPRTVVEIAGGEGDLVITTAGAAGGMGIQISELALRGARGIGSPLGDLPTPAGYRHVPAQVPGQPALNIAQFYARLADGIHTMEPRVPDFAHALRVHRLLDTIELAAHTGTRQSVA